MKFAIVLLLGVCAFQAFEARSIDEVKKIGDIIDDIKNEINNLNQLSTDIVETEKNVGTSLAAIYTNMKTDVDVVTDHVRELVKDTTSAVADIAATGEKGRECVAEHQNEINHWEYHVTDKLTVCTTNGYQALEQISSAVQVWAKDVKSFIDDIDLSIQLCTQDFSRPEKVLACLQKEYSGASQDYNTLNQVGAKLMDAINTKDNLILDGFLNCANAAHDESADKAHDIIRAINDCVAH